MPKASPSLTQFNAGELSPLLDGRSDIQKYANGCRRMENFIPLVQGPALRRPGLRFIAPVKTAARRTWLARFEFSATDAYILEFGHQYIRFYTNRGQLLIGAPAAWVTATAYVAGDLVEQSGTNYYCTTDHTSGTFATDLAAGKWHALTGSIYEIPSPYSESDLITAEGTFRLSMVQSGDVIYIAHPSYAPRKLSRFASNTWTLASADFKGGPFRDVDPDSTTTVYASAETGTGITITASTAIFTAAHVGSLFLIEAKKTDDVAPWEVAKSVTINDLRRSDGNVYKALNTATTGTVKPIHSEGARYDGVGGVQWEYQHSGYGWAKITAIGGGGTTATVDVVSRVPSMAVGSGNPTNKWAFGEWSSAFGYPSCVTFFRERLTFARGQQLWMSVAADFENFADRDSGDVTAEMAVAMTVQSDQANAIVWLASGDVLLVGTAGTEFLVAELASGDPFGPGNVMARQQSAYGSREMPARAVGDSVLFVQKSGRKLRDIRYSFEADKYQAADTTVLAEHVCADGLVSTAYQQEPWSVLWCATGVGDLVGFTFNREQDVVAWHRHPLGGAGLVECVESIPSPDGSRDDLWAIVRRTINGATVRYVELLTEGYSGTLADAQYMDCCATYSGVPADVITGLDYLEGQTVTVLADGAPHPDRVVSGGQITLQDEHSTVHVGLACPCLIETMRLEAGAADGTAQGKTKRIHRVTLRLRDTLGGASGPDETDLDTLLFRSSADAMDAAPAIYTGDMSIAWPSGYDTDARMVYRNEQPLPAMLMAIYPQVVTQDR